MEIVCPLDKKDDTIQKVSSIVVSGTTRGSYSGPSGGVVRVDGKWGYSRGFIALSGGTATELAKKLTPPNKPKKYGGLGFWWFFIISFAGFPFAPTILILLSSSLIYQTPGLYENHKVLIDMALGIPAVISAIVCNFYWYRYWINKNKKIKKVNEEKYNNEIKTWNKSLNVWDKLYYCFKHDIVFDTENGKSIKTNDALKYCGF